MALKELALSSLAPAVFRRMRWAYLGYGVVAYAGLHVAKRIGVFGDYPERAIDFIDNQVKSAVGLGEKKNVRDAQMA